jgi:hypothetical protein
VSEEQLNNIINRQIGPVRLISRPRPASRKYVSSSPIYDGSKNYNPNLRPQPRPRPVIRKSQPNRDRDIEDNGKNQLDRVLSMKQFPSMRRWQMPSWAQAGPSTQQVPSWARAGPSAQAGHGYVPFSNFKNDKNK